MNKNQINEAIYLACWTLGTLLLVRLIELIFDTTGLSAWSLIFLGLGMFFFLHAPMFKRGFSQTVDVSVGVTFVGMFVLYFGFAVLGPKLDSDLADVAPCGSKTLEARCYRLSPSACRSAWDSYKIECEAEAQLVAKSPTQLTGAGVKRCTQKRLNKYMSFNQRNEDGSGCASYFQSLKD